MPAATPTYRSSPTFTGGRTFSRTASFARPLYYGRDDALKLFLDVGRTIGESPLSNTQISALATLIASLKSAGNWDKIDALYPIVGGTAGWHSLNLKSATKYRMIANGTITNSSNGTQGNGVNGYWDTTYDFQANTGDGHISIYSRTDSAADVYDFGIINNNTNNIANLIARSSSDISDYIWVNSGDTPANSSSLGLFSLCGNNSSSELFKNGLSISTGAGGTEAPDGTLSYFMALNNVGTAEAFSNRQYAFFTFGRRMDATQNSNFNTAVTAYQTSLGRQV